MSDYLSPFTGQDVDSAVSAVISGGITSSINTAVSGGVVSANVYTDLKTSMTPTALTGTAGAYTVPVLSGGIIYTCDASADSISITSVTSNSVGDIIHFTAAVDSATVDLPAGLVVLLWNDIVVGSSYDLMVCDNRVVLKEVAGSTQ